MVINSSMVCLSSGRHKVVNLQRSELLVISAIGAVRLELRRSRVPGKDQDSEVDRCTGHNRNEEEDFVGKLERKGKSVDFGGKGSTSQHLVT
jgi:hypothetical protein